MTNPISSIRLDRVDLSLDPFEYNLLSEFIRIKDENSKVSLKERCWNVVITQKSGATVIKAASVYFSVFGCKDEKVKISFLENQEMRLPIDIFEALKKDSKTIGSMVDMGVEGLYLNLRINEFRDVLHYLYPKRYPDCSLDDITIIEIVNYLDMSDLLSKLLRKLKDKIVTLDLESAFVLNQRILASVVRNQLFMKEIINKNLGEYFANRIMEEEDDLSRKVLIDKYNINNVSSLAFCKYSFTVNIILLDWMSKCNSLKYLLIVNAINIHTWPKGFPNLEYLELRNPIILNIAEIKNFPDSLRTLVLFNPGALDGDILVLLPRGLTSLSISYAPHITNVGLNNIPLHLEELTLSRYQSNSLILFPQKLHKLVLRGHYELPDIHFLPPFLDTLEVDDSVYFSDREIAQLPTTLRVLRMTRIDKITLLGLRALPPLTELTMVTCQQLTVADIEAIPETVRILDFSYLMKEMPSQFLKKFTQLEVFKIRSGSINDEHLKHLPITLVKVVFAECRNLTNHGIKNLSRNLKSIAFTGCRHISEKGIPDLPEDMDELIFVQGRRISNNGIILLPRKIRVLNISTSNITDGAFVFLPRWLELLNISYCSNIRGTCLEYLPSTLRRLDITYTKFAKENLARLPKVVEVVT